MARPALVLDTQFVVVRPHRITTTREPDGVRAPSFVLARGPSACAWAVNADVPAAIATELDALAMDEPPTADGRAEAHHAARYRELFAGAPVEHGPCFVFPELGAATGDDIRVVATKRELEQHFRGWGEGEIAGERAPVIGLCVDGAIASVCFCARRSDVAAEAGLETAEAFRGRGLAARVTAAWARAIRASGRTPMYSTSWTNTASLAVARKLDLRAFASLWSLG